MTGRALRQFFLLFFGVFGQVAVVVAVVVVAIPAAASADSASAAARSAEPVSGVLDGFDGRGSERPLDQWGNWSPTSIDGAGQLLGVFEEAAGLGAAGSGSSVRREVVAGDVEVHATVSALPGAGESLFLYMHLRDVGGSGWDGYRLRVERGTGARADTVAIQEIRNGAAAPLASGSLGRALQAGDGFLLRQFGERLWVSRRVDGEWAEILDAPAELGLHGRLGLGSASRSARFDDFGGSGSTSPKPPLDPSPYGDQGASSSAGTQACGDAPAYASTGDTALGSGSGCVSTMSGHTITLSASPNPTPPGTVSFTWSVTPADECADNRGHGDFGSGLSFQMHVDASFEWQVTCGGFTIQSYTTATLQINVGSSPIGQFDLIQDNRVAKGWACDPDSYSAQIGVHFYVDGPGLHWVGSTTAHHTRPDVAGACGGNPHHAFEFTIPDSLGNGQWRPLYAYAINCCGGAGNPLLGGSPKHFRFLAPISPPSVAPPGPVSSPAAGEPPVTLTTTQGSWYGAPSEWWYAWLRESSIVWEGQDEPYRSYSVTEADWRSWMRSRVTACVPPTCGSSYSANSVWVAPRPVPTAAPTISAVESISLEDAFVDDVLQTSNGSWTENPGGPFYYQWLRDGVPITGATSQTYMLKWADVGRTIRASVKACAQFCSSAYAQSSNSLLLEGIAEEQTYGAGEDGRGSIAACACDHFADPVNSRTGAFTTTVDDLDLPGTGVSFAWGRSYTSEDTSSGRLGPGWRDSYSATLTVQGDGDVLVRGEDGQQLEYGNAGGGTFLDPPGALASLRAVTGGYELTRTDQVVYSFDTSGRLLWIKDRHNQGVTLTYDGQGRLASVTDAANRQATIAYNPQNLVSQVQTPDGRSVAYGYTNGRLTSVTDVRGKTWTYTYDAGGRLQSIIDPLNHAEVTNVYGADGRVISQTDALGKETTFAWNAATETATATDANENQRMHDYDDSVLVKEVDPLGNDTDLVPDGDLNATQVTGPTNETTQFTHDAAGNVLTATAPSSLGSVRKTFVYNTKNDVELVTDARNKVTDYQYSPTTSDLTAVTQDGTQIASYTYDTAGRMQTFTDGNEKTSTYTYFPTTGYLQSSTDPLGNKTTYTYDAAGRVLTRVDPKGNVPGCNCAVDFTWTYTYDAAGNQLTERNPLGHTTTNVYDDAGRLTSTTDALGRTTTYTYDNANRLLTETAPDPDGAGQFTAPVTSYTYDDVGNNLTETDPRGNTTTFAYDDANRLIRTTGPDPDGAGPQQAPVTTNTYDANGNLASTVEPRGNVTSANPDHYRTSFTYDAAGRVKTEARPDPDGAGPKTPSVTTNDYDAVGNLRWVRDANGRQATYTHDAAGRILTVAGPPPAGGLTTYTYDDAGHVLTRKDDNNHTTTFAYDNAGRLLSETSPDPDGAGPKAPAVTTHTYDPNGNRLTVTDANGNATPAAGDGVTTYGYDRANRLTSINYSDSTPDVTFTYDAAGNQLTMSDGSGTETRTYDNLDRLLTVTRGPDTFSYAYDAASNLTRRTYPDNTNAFYTYDPMGRTQSLSTSATPSPANTTSYAYDAGSNLVQTTLPLGSGYVETRAYDNAARLTEVKHQRGATALSRFVSDLDPVGNPLQITRTGTLNQTQTYTYDAADRITSVCFQAGACPGAADPFIRWTYDKIGNRLSEQRPTGTTTYAYDARDRLLSAGSTTFAYDENGNQTQKGSRTFAYDLANRLKSTTDGPTTTNYAYDGQGKRIAATGGGGTASAPTIRTPCSTATGTSDTATASKPAGATAGDLLIVGLAFEKGWDVTITPPSGWVRIRRTDQSSNVGYATYRKTAGASEPATYAFALTNSPKWSIGACAVAGADATAPVDVQADASGANGNPSAPSLTTTGANRLVLAFYANKKPAGYSSYSAPAVERFDAPNTTGGLPSNAMASYEQVAAGATGPKSATVGEQAEWVAQHIAIKPAPGGSSTTIQFLWDITHPLPELALERDGNNQLLRRYLHDGALHSLYTPAGSFYYHADPLGSITNVTDATGLEQASYSYEPFGATRTETANGGVTNVMKFAAEYLDPTGLYHLRARQYDPASGRFTTLDPVEAAVGAPLVSAFAYAANRPGVLIDPSGETFVPANLGSRASSFAASQHNAESPLICLPLSLSPLCGAGGGWARWVSPVRTPPPGGRPPSPKPPPPGNLPGNLAKAGELKPGPGWIAHHIVAFRHRLAVDTRVILERAKVPIHDARNGVWIRKRGGHPDSYYRLIDTRIQGAWRRGGAKGVERELADIKELIKKGKIDL
jgi:RHS repeat-associated protein